MPQCLSNLVDVSTQHKRPSEYFEKLKVHCILPLIPIFLSKSALWHGENKYKRGGWQRERERERTEGESRPHAIPLKAFGVGGSGDQRISIDASKTGTDSKP